MECLHNTKAIVKRELKSYFESPIAYVFLVVFLMLTAFLTFSVGRYYENGQADLRAFFWWHPWVYLILVPAAAMRLWAEERRAGTIELLLTMPVTAWQAIVGKFIASWIFLAIGLFLTFPLVFTVAYLGSPDLGAIFCGYLGSLLMAGAYLAVSSMTSAITRNQVVSFIISVVICMFLILAGWPPVTDMLVQWAPTWLVDGIASFSVMPHYETFQRGLIDSRDMAYFVLVMAFCLFTTGVIIRSHRAG